MGRGRRLLAAVGCLLTTLAMSGHAVAQDGPPASTPLDELPADVRDALADVSDGAISFDHPAFYELVAHIRASRHSPGHTRPPVEIENWRDLAERPNAYRGAAVTVEGRVGRNKSPYTLPRYPELGTLTQLELYRPDQPLACTVVVTGDVGDVPVGSTIRVTGYFVMIRKYLDRSERARHAALLVAPGITSITQPAPSTEHGGRLGYLLGALVLGLVAAWVLLRRAARGTRRSLADLRATHPAPLNLADDLAEWAEGGDNPDTAAAGHQTDVRP